MPILHSLTNSLIHRWNAMLTHAAMHAFAASLLDQDLSGCHNLEGNTPSISEILAEVTSPPPTTADFQPFCKETGSDLALSFAHPGAAGI